jgi:hypothetical protein
MWDGVAFLGIYRGRDQGTKGLRDLVERFVRAVCVALIYEFFVGDLGWTGRI